LSLNNGNFISFRDTILRSFTDFGVEYKVFGGTAIQLIYPLRETGDIDMFVRKTHENLQRLIHALEFCGFSTWDLLVDILYDGNEFGSCELEGTYMLNSIKDEWKEYHIDLSFGIGGFDYESVPGDTIKKDELSVSIVSYEAIATMKRNVYPPRMKDAADIEGINMYLNTKDENALGSKKKSWWGK